MTSHQFTWSPWRKSTHSGSEGSECVEVAAFWRKSSHSEGSEGQCVEVAALWSKSSHSSGSEGQCVEVAAMTHRGVALRDSKDVDGPMLSIAPSAWASLLADVKAGVFDSES
ncbi:DUF397 domain-containing protein [Actinomadura madurae]|uniref:DUF397 domain-containing protein n=1 Tax=Actinomadura madurae TaxID=1993 RepID=UPI002025EA33|nr:DUF397 domain-containing protein [Actinomadura madurae]URN00658.1 DUF397 domain-containing protein [Actinomadura madurae]URN02807.1 DUF397 domain-containing protein [Actinomadura madurae]